MMACSAQRSSFFSEEFSPARRFAVCASRRMGRYTARESKETHKAPSQHKISRPIKKALHRLEVRALMVMALETRRTIVTPLSGDDAAIR